MTDDIAGKDWERVEAHYPDDADMTLQVLKGHLLVEELLRQIFELLLAHPDALKGDRGTTFECHQIICLVEAISPHSRDEAWIWSAAKRLNNLRNELAHNLEPKALDQKAQALIAFVTRDNEVVRSILERLGTPEGMEFKAVILAMCGCLSSLKALVLQEAQGAA
jgi:hypothetical protein